MMKLLYFAGANLDLVDDSSHTAFDIAAKNGQVSPGSYVLVRLDRS